MHDACLELPVTIFFCLTHRKSVGMKSTTWKQSQHIGDSDRERETEKESERELLSKRKMGEGEGEEEGKRTREEEERRRRKRIRRGGRGWDEGKGGEDDIHTASFFS